jgi:Bacterial regulatory protein, Fis family
MNQSRHPTFSVYSVISRQDSGEEWLSIGQAVPHRDGHGFDVILQALPLNPKLVLRDSALPESQTPDGHVAGGGVRSLKQQVDAFERTLIEHYLLEAGGKINAVMERLDIPRRTLSEKISRLGIDRLKLVQSTAANGAPQSPHDPVSSHAGHHETAANSNAHASPITSQPPAVKTASRPDQRSETR